MMRVSVVHGRLAAALILLMAISVACEQSKPITTIEEAETIAIAKDVFLTNKEAHEQHPLATAAFGYRCGEAAILIQQFKSSQDAEKWQCEVTSLPYTGAVIVLRGAIGFMISNGQMSDRRKIAKALR